MYYCMFHKKWIDDKDKLKTKCLNNVASKTKQKGIKYKKCKHLIEFENDMFEQKNTKYQKNYK